VISIDDIEGFATTKEQKEFWGIPRTSYTVTISSTIEVEAENEDEAQVVAAEQFDFGSADIEVCDPDEEDDEISIVWSVDDVKEQCKWLTDEQAKDVLHNLKHKHDPCIGINWDVINITADILFGERS
jgi:hypothetical protein